MNTTRRERFEKVASKRVQKILDFLDLLGNCSNRNNYEYSIQDVDLMFKEINKALKDSRNLFDKELNRINRTGFKF